MKRYLKTHWKIVTVCLFVIILTILAIPKSACWRQFVEPVSEGTWKQFNHMNYAYERKLSREETRTVRKILNETTLYDLREVGFDRDGAVFNGELRINGQTYGVDFNSRLILSDKEIGWLSEEHVSWLKQTCVIPSVLQTANNEQ